MKSSTSLTGIVRVVLFCVTASAALAMPRWEEVSFGLGVNEVLDSQARETVYSVEARFSPLVWELRPWVHGSVTSRESVYVGAGLAYVWEGAGPWSVGLGIGPGYYNRRNGLDLGGKYQNLSFIEGGYRFDNGMKLGARFAHLSNAGVRSRNPGTEILTVQWTVPIR